MRETSLDQDSIAGFQLQKTVIQLQMEPSLKNMYDLKKRMPVVWHGVSRMDP